MTFPLQLQSREPFSVPWALVGPHEKRAQYNHGGQTLERLAQRGGLSPAELVALIDGQDVYRLAAQFTEPELLERIAEAVRGLHG